MAGMVKQMGGPNGLLSNMQRAQQQGGRNGNPIPNMPNMGGLQDMMSKMMGGGGMPDFSSIANMMGGQSGIQNMMNSMMGGMGGPQAIAQPPSQQTAAPKKVKAQRVRRK